MIPQYPAHKPAALISSSKASSNSKAPIALQAFVSSSSSVPLTKKTTISFLFS